MTTSEDRPTKTKSEYQVEVADHPNVMIWMKQVAKKDPEGFLRLVGDNTQIFRKMWGKENFKDEGGKGWTSGWSIYENSLHWLVLTGEQGTLFRLRISMDGESYLKDPRVGVGVIQYLTWLMKTIA